MSSSSSWQRGLAVTRPILLLLKIISKLPQTPMEAECNYLNFLLMHLLQVAVCKQPSAFTRENHTCSKSIIFLGICKSRLDTVGRTAAYSQIKLFFFLKYNLYETFRGTECCTRNWQRAVVRRQKKSPFWQNGKITFSWFHKNGKHILCSSQFFLAIEDKFMQNSLSHPTTKIRFGLPRKGKFVQRFMIFT